MLNFSLAQKIVDTCIILISWAIAYSIRFDFLSGQQGLGLTFLKISPFIVLITLYSFSKASLYQSMRFSSRFKEIYSVFRANTSASIFLVILLYFTSQERISRATILMYFGISTVLLVLFRMTVRNILRRVRQKGRNLRHVLVIGNGQALIDYIHTAKKFKDSGIRFLGWMDSHGRSQELKINIPELTDTFEDIKSSKNPDSIIISYEGSESYKASKFIAEHYNDVIPIQVLPELNYSMVGNQIEDFGGIPVIGVNQPSLNPYELLLKYSGDFILTLIGCICISPLLFFVALGVKLSSPGPILFGQRRVGLDGKEFLMWKFRSMRVADDSKQTQEWSNKENPRKTRFGDFIRKTSLDELPQLLNVLKGEMSLVGPRPEQPFFVEKFRHEIPGYMLKHKMKPGMTGWAQVNGWRGDTDLNKRIECDIYYIKNWSLWLDVKILFLTLFKGFINKNAY